MKNKINIFSREDKQKQVHPNILNVESDHHNKHLAFKLKCIAFIQSCRCLKRFKFSFIIKDHKNDFFKS